MNDYIYIYTYIVVSFYFDQHEMDNNLKLDLPKGRQQAHTHTHAPLTRSLPTFSESPTTDKWMYSAFMALSPRLALKVPRERRA